MSLREDLLKSNGVSATGSSPKAPVSTSTSLRDKLLADNKLTVTTSAAPVSSARESLLQKNKVGAYANTPAPAPVAAKPTAPVAPVKRDITQDTIASPEYFSKSVDVKNAKGKYVETYTGDNAYENAKAKAAELGGTTSVTKAGGFVTRAFDRAKEVIGGALNDFGDKTVTALGLDRTIDLKTGKMPEERSQVQKGADALRAGLAGVNVVFAPLSGTFAAAEEVPVLRYPAAGINYIFGKLGEAGNWVGSKAVDTLPVSPETKEIIRPAAEELSALLAQIAGGKLGGKSLEVAKTKTETLRNDIKEKVTKDVVTTYNLPKTVYIDGSKIKSIFQRGDKISPEELDMVKALGLDGTGYKDAINNGLSIEIPAEKIVTITDKPWFAKIKSAIGTEPTQVITTTKVGEAQRAPRALLDEPQTGPRIVETPAATDNTRLAETVTTTKISDPVPPTVQKVASEPITPSTLDTISKFTPEEFSAFGRKIVDGINREVGKDNVTVTDQIDVLKQQMEALENTGFKALQKYESKSGEFKGELNINNGTGKFSREYDTKLREVFNDMDNKFSAEELISKYTELKESYGNMKEELSRLEKGGKNNLEAPKISDAAARNSGLPDSVDVLEMGSPDGRPAEFKQGRIKVYLPDLVRDIKALAEGKKILAHGGANAKVYMKKEGESFEALSLRYTKDVLVHELSHEKTVSLADDTMSKQLRKEIMDARATGDQRKIIEANTNMQKFMESLEEKALTYERANRKALEDEIFTTESTPTQRKIDRTVSPAPAKKVTATETKLLKDKLKNQATGARAGKQAGIEEKNKEIEVRKEGFSIAMEKLKDRQASIQQKRQALVEYAEAFLPLRERGKFIRAIRYPGSDKEFLDILASMQRASKTVERKAIISDIATELKGAKVTIKDKKPNANFEYNAQKKLDRIRANINGDYAAAQQKIVDVISEFQNSNPDSILPSEILEQIQELKMVGVKDMTVEELRTTLADIKSIKETGRTLKDLERFNRDTKVQQVKDGVIETLTGGTKNPKADQGLRRPEDKPTAYENVVDFFTLKQAGFEEILDSLSKFDKTSKPYESFINKHFTTKVSESFAKQTEGELVEVNKLNDLIKKSHDIKNDGKLFDYLNDMHEKVVLKDVKMADGTTKEITITKGEALQMYMWSKDETLHDTFTEGLNWGEEAQKKVFDLLSEKDKKLADDMLGFYREYYKGINEVFQREYGVDLPFNENYSPVSRNVETSIPENVMLAQEMKSYATAKNNSLKSRVQNNIDLKPKDAFQNMVSHINMMEHYKAWGETMYEARRVFGDKEVRQTIDDYHGRKYLKEVDSFLNDFARDGVDRAKIVPAVDALRTNTTRAILGLPNFTTPIKQLTGISNYWIELSTPDFFGGVANFWSAPLEKSKFLRENSSALRERFGEGYERDIKHALATGYAKKLSKKNNTLTEGLFYGLRQADKFTVLQGSWAAYRAGFNKAKAEGKSVTEAKAAGIKLAEDLTNRVQESSRLDTLSAIQRSGSYGKLFTMLQSQPSKYSRIIWNTLRNIKYERGSKATNIKRLAILYFVVPTLYNLVSQQFVDDEYKDTPGEFATKTLLGPLTYPLIFGQIFQSLYGWATGSNFSYNASPVFSIMDDMKKALQNINQDDIGEAITYFTDAAGKIGGVPTPPIMRIVRKVMKEDTGGATYPVN